MPDSGARPQVLEVRIISDNQGGGSKGFGYLEIADRPSAYKALDLCARAGDCRGLRWARGSCKL